MADIFNTISNDTLVKEIIKGKKDRVQLVGFGSFSKTKSTTQGFPGSTDRFLTGRIKYSHIVLKRIAEKLKEVNPEFAEKLIAHELSHVVQEGNTKVVKATPAKKVVKFKAGSELADSVKSVTPENGGDAEVEVITYKSEPADVKKLADELVNLTVKESGEPVPGAEILIEQEETTEVKSTVEAEALKSQLEEEGAEVELK